MPAPHDLTALELLKAYKSKKLSPVDVVDDVITHIGQWEPQLKALYAPDFDAARAAAKASAARWKKGKPAGSLDGVPITIKENIASKGVPVPLGTAATTLVPAPADAPPTARVREAGAIILAKTTMPDYGMLSSGLSSFHPLTRNPWDLSKNPGGSSAGAGAAAAAGYGPLHIGTDIGGSVRLPAGWCGVFGLKPSLGRIPIDPPYVGRVAGPMTRTVQDSALLMSVLSQPDARDHMSLPPQKIAWMKLEREVKGLKIGLQLDAGYGLPVDTEVKAAVEAAARLFAKAGAKVTPMKPILSREVFDGLDNFWRARAWDDIVRLPPETRVKILPFIAGWARQALQLSSVDVIRGFNRIMEMRKLAAAACAPFDFVLSPTAPIAAYAAELPCPTNDSSRPLEHIGFTVLWNMSEQPAASINCGYTRGGLPIGLQIVGRRFDDLGVLQLARWFEQRRPPQKPWPVPR
jgi:aspartyl-tRNA(Asn)/glutamyl-tRNA(Gln) amidotransferase subunit A